MMDDLLSLDFNFLDDDDLLSFPLTDDFNPIESREIESILNELENSANDKILTDFSSFCQIKPTISMFKPGKANKKSKNKIGTSLLARPPKKLKKDKNSILLMNKPNNSNSLLVNKSSNQISQAKFSNYFYNEHNYCIKPLKRSFNDADFVDLNNNFKLDDEDNITIEFTKEEIIVTSNQDDELLKKKNQPFNLITSNMFNGSYDKVHDLDDFFNISFTNSEETNSDSLSSNHSESEEDDSNQSTEQENEVSEKASVESKKEEPTFSKPVESIAKVESNEECPEKCAEKAEPTKVELIAKTSPLLKKEVKNIIIDDINNYNINDTDNDELNSLDEDEDDEEDDILIETDILIDEIDNMFGDFEEYDLISSNKRLRTSKNASVKKNNRNVNSKPTKQNNQRDRRSRTISNSYSVRSGSSCSCCSDELSEEELLKRPTHDQSKHHQQKSSHKQANRRSISKLIKADNTFIRKKNTGRFINRIKNTSF